MKRWRQQRLKEASGREDKKYKFVENMRNTKYNIREVRVLFAIAHILESEMFK